MSPISVSGGVLLLLGAFAGPSSQEPDEKREPQGEFRLIRRPGSVDLEQAYDLAGLAIPKDEIHTLLPKDSIPALTNPSLVPASSIDWLGDSDRLVVVGEGEDALAVPFRILDWHEVVNTTVGKVPVAITYCPLCDSAGVFDRRVGTPAPKDEVGSSGPRSTLVLEFGVSGALYNSNVLMYDRTYRGLWSQVAMRAVSGPLVGRALAIHPFRIESFRALRARAPQMAVVDRSTGHARDYTRSPYESYLKSEGLRVPVKAMGAALPAKTLGLGLLSGGRAWFVPLERLGAEFSLEVPGGRVRIAAREGGFELLDAPAGAQLVQTFYYSWSAFFPRTEIVDAR